MPYFYFKDTPFYTLSNPIKSILQIYWTYIASLSIVYNAFGALTNQLVEPFYNGLRNTSTQSILRLVR